MSSKVIVTIFGASGDLAKRKLYPSLFRLYKSGNLSENFAVIGTARRPWSKEYFESVVVESITDLADSPQQAQEFASHFYYQSHDVNDTEHYIALRELQNSLDEKYQTEHNKVFFLSMAPQFFGTIAKHLKSEGIVDGQGFERLIVEKPFGTDLETASQLNKELEETFDEEQIFRIDHYLGKEMIQNIFAIRFGNLIFDNLWNRDFIDNIQITAWGLKNAVATMITLGPFEIWCKTIPFSFCHCLPWINQLPLPRMQFGQKKLKFLSNCTIQQMRN